LKLHQIAISMLPYVGDTNGKKLIAYCGGVEAVFKESRKNLEKIPGISQRVINSITQHAEVMRNAEKELRLLEDQNIQCLFYLDDEYPRRLKQCNDGPMLVYTKGKGDLNPMRVASIVGTRTPSIQGKKNCEKLVKKLSTAGVQIISGLAYGIDVCAHRAALKSGLSTVGVLGSGIDWIYPGNHKKTAEEMMEQGAILSELRLGSKPDRQNFPMRNRIVAGMSDIVIVVESAARGGSLITANLGFGYSRDVAAFPGRPDDEYSRGCNRLIKNNMASLIESGDDVLKMMNWAEEKEGKKEVQRSLFVEMDEAEKIIYRVLEDGKSHTIDSISMDSGLPMSKTSSLLLSLEFKGIVKALPGKAYQLMG
jgi:DNA processing protein